MMYLAMAFFVVALVAGGFGLGATFGTAVEAGQILFIAFITMFVGSLLANGPRLARLAAHRRVDPFIRGLKRLKRHRRVDPLIR